MQQFHNKKFYKDCEPYATVQRIRDILYNYGFFSLDDVNLYIPSKRLSNIVLSTVELVNDNLEQFHLSADGKGINARYSLAAAYGELMERIQSFKIFGNYYFNALNKGDLLFDFAPDEKKIIFKDLPNETWDIIKKALDLSDMELNDWYRSVYNKECICLPFFDCFENKEVLVPAYFLYSSETTMGLSAGNTPREALVQGISEIIENVTMMLAFLHNAPVGKLAKESFSGTYAVERLNKLQQDEFEYDVLDMSMGLNLPVIGLRIKNKKNGNVRITIGADPCPTMALEKALVKQPTAKYHIRSCGVLKDKLTVQDRKEYFEEYTMVTKIRDGKLPDNVFYPQEVYNECFIGVNGNLDDDFAYLMNIIQSFDEKLYIRDMTFLEFPVIYSFVPGLSCLSPFKGREMKQFRKFPLNDFAVLNENAYKSILPVILKMQELLAKSVEGGC